MIARWRAIMNANHTKDFQYQLQSELDSVRCEFLSEFKHARQEFTGHLAVLLENSLPSEWVDLGEDQISPIQYPRYKRNLELEASLCQIEIEQYGYCNDYEKHFLKKELEQNPAKQRCAGCTQKLQNKQHN